MWNPNLESLRIRWLHIYGYSPAKMSNFGTLRHTDGVQVSTRPVWIPAVATMLAAAMFAITIISLRPFRSSDTAIKAITDGDALNQLGYGALACVAIVGMLCLADSRRVATLLSPAWLVMLGFVAMGCLTAIDPSASARGAAFTVAAMIVICATLTLPRDGDAMASTIAFMCVAVLGICYAGVLLAPGLAIHSGAPPQPEHAGLWRGSFSHKNTAGPVMACIAFAAVYLYRRGWAWIGLMIFVAAMIFTIKTGSKTTVALVPLAVLVVVLPSIIGWRKATVLVFLLAVSAIAISTLGIVFIPPVKAMVHAYFPNLTYTGRTDIWTFAGEMLPKRLWTGYGFEGFWTTPIVDNTILPFDTEWDVRGAGHAHNGYLDIALTLGLPALIALVVAFIIEPARDYLRVPPRRENIFLGDLFMMILFFTLLNAFLESFFFRRADAIWLLFVFSALGLRMVARYPLQSSWRKQSRPLTPQAGWSHQYLADE